MPRFLLPFLVAGALLAHHSIDAEYDRAKPTEYRAKIIEMAWVNPHATFTAVVTQPEGDASVWTFELAAPRNLLNSGWSKDSLKAGDIVTVKALPLKKGTGRGATVSIKFADGHTLLNNDPWWEMRITQNKQ